MFSPNANGVGAGDTMTALDSASTFGERGDVGHFGEHVGDSG